LAPFPRYHKQNMPRFPNYSSITRHYSTIPVLTRLVSVLVSAM